MLKTGVTSLCIVSVLAAGLLSFRLRATVRTPSPLTGDEPFRQRLGVTVGRTTGMVAGGMIAGLLTVGAGGRLLMRVLAASSPDDVQGRQTDAEEIVGEVTASGTVFFIIFVGLSAGLMGVVLFATLRRWLPTRSVGAGLTGLAIGAGALIRPSAFLDPDNHDFEILSPAALAVALCLATLVVFGTTFGVLVDHLAPRWPAPRWSPIGVASILPLAVLALSPPMLAIAGVAVLVGTSAPARRRPPDDPPPSQPGRPAGRRRIGVHLVRACAGLGIASIALAAIQILTA